MAAAGRAGEKGERVVEMCKEVDVFLDLVTGGVSIVQDAARREDHLSKRYEVAESTEGRNEERHVAGAWCASVFWWGLVVELGVQSLRGGSNKAAVRLPRCTRMGNMGKHPHAP